MHTIVRKGVTGKSSAALLLFAVILAKRRKQFQEKHYNKLLSGVKQTPPNTIHNASNSIYY
jgi:hypothetical protein